MLIFSSLVLRREDVVPLYLTDYSEAVGKGSLVRYCNVSIMLRKLRPFLRPLVGGVLIFSHNSTPIPIMIFTMLLFAAWRIITVRINANAVTFIIAKLSFTVNKH